MNIDMREVRQEDLPLLERLGQLYQYDFSEFLGFDVRADGTYTHLWFGFLNDASYHGFLVHVDGVPAGFALVRQRGYFSDDPEITDMDEFFIMRKYRRQGVGRDVARRLFETFPGRWELRELGPHTAAQAFWRSVIGDYSGGHYEERVVGDERWRGPVQSFDTGDRAEG